MDIHLPESSVVNDAPTLVLETSGTEGMPKRVVLSSETFRASASMGQQIEDLRQGDCWLNCLPQHHVSGLSIHYRCDQAGASMLLQRRFSTEKIEHALELFSVTHLSLVPVMLSKLLDHYGDKRAPEGLRTVLIGGDRLPLPLARRAVAAGWPIVVSYGMTETASRIAMLRLTHENIGSWEGTDVGPPLPGVQISIGDEGEVCIRSDVLFPGEQREIMTRDQGRIDERGHLHILGRLDHQILTGGELVDPAAVEQMLLQAPCVDEVAVTSVFDAVWGEHVVAVVVGEGQDDQLEQWARRHLPAHQRPREMIWVDSLQRNHGGKVDRAWLTRVAQQGT